MHLEKNIIKGKFGHNKELIKEAHEEIAEMKQKGKKRDPKKEALEKKKKGGRE